MHVCFSLKCQEISCLLVLTTFIIPNFQSLSSNMLTYFISVIKMHRRTRTMFISNIVKNLTSHQFQSQARPETSTGGFEAIGSTLQQLSRGGTRGGKTAVGSRLKWKRLVTDCQIVQFVFSFGLSGWMLREHLFGSGCSRIWAWCFNAAFNASLLALFFNFHSKNYAKKTREGVSKKRLD